MREPNEDKGWWGEGVAFALLLFVLYAVMGELDRVAGLIP